MIIILRISKNFPWELGSYALVTRQNLFKNERSIHVLPGIGVHFNTSGNNTRRRWWEVLGKRSRLEEQSCSTHVDAPFLYIIKIWNLGFIFLIFFPYRINRFVLVISTKEDTQAHGLYLLLDFGCIYMYI